MTCDLNASTLALQNLSSEAREGQMVLLREHVALVKALDPSSPLLELQLLYYPSEDSNNQHRCAADGTHIKITDVK